MRLLERRLGEVEWSPTEQSIRADEYQNTVFEKEKVIKNLECEVESQVISFFYHTIFTFLLVETTTTLRCQAS